MSWDDEVATDENRAKLRQDAIDLKNRYRGARWQPDKMFGLKSEWQ